MINNIYLKLFFYSSYNLEQFPLDFPFIVKPNIGERGIGVELIRNKFDFKNYLALHDNSDLILQEYINYPLEFGVFLCSITKRN